MTNMNLSTPPSQQSLATEINDHHRQAGECLKAGIDHALQAGRLLQAVKAKIPHGQFQRWVFDNCEFSIRTAQKYLRIDSRWKAIESKAPSTALLGIEESLKLIADERPKTLPTTKRTLRTIDNPRPGRLPAPGEALISSNLGGSYCIAIFSWNCPDDVVEVWTFSPGPIPGGVGKVLRGRAIPRKYAYYAIEREFSSQFNLDFVEWDFLPRTLDNPLRT